MRVRFVLAVGLIVGGLTAFGVIMHALLYGSTPVLHTLLVLFLSTNLLICWSEISLYFERDYVRSRADYWQDWQARTGRSPAFEFFLTKVAFSDVFTKRLWGDMWGSYSTYDRSFAESRSFGFNCDVGNGFVTILPTLLLYFAVVFRVFPAWLVGLVGIALYWQWAYVTALYLMSFYVGGRHRELSTRNLLLIVWGSNLPWIVFPLIGLFVSCRLVLSGDFDMAFAW